MVKTFIESLHRMLCRYWGLDDPFLLRTPQQRLPVFFNWLDNPQNCPFQGGSRSPWPHLIHGSLGPHESAPKRHLDLFSRFCAPHPCAQHTDTQTTLRATSVAIGRIYAMHVMRPNNTNNNIRLADCYASAWVLHARSNGELLIRRRR